MKLIVSQTDLNWMDLQWEIDNYIDEDIFILRSEQAIGPFESIAGPFKDRDTYRDPLLPANRFRKWYYKVKWGDNIYPQEGVCLEAPMDLKALEIARLEKQALAEFNGRKVIFLPKKTWGQRCNRCFDFVTGQRRGVSTCLTCFDTTFVGGYNQPLQVFMGIHVNAAMEKDDHIRTQVKTATGRLGNYPRVKPGDIVIESENERWEIGSTVQLVEKLRAIIMQKFTLINIMLGDIRYNIPVKLPIENATSPRELRPKDTICSGSIYI